MTDPDRLRRRFRAPAASSERRSALGRILVGALDAPQSSVAAGANHSAARAGATAFRGINGAYPRRPALALRPTRAPSIYSTCRCARAWSRSSWFRTATDECGAGISSTPSQRRGINSQVRLPRKLGQALLNNGRNIVRIQLGEPGPLQGRTVCSAGRLRLPIVAAWYRRGLLPLPGVPP